MGGRASAGGELRRHAPRRGFASAAGRFHEIRQQPHWLVSAYLDRLLPAIPVARVLAAVHSAQEPSGNLAPRSRPDRSILTTGSVQL